MDIKSLSPVAVGKRMNIVPSAAHPVLVEIPGRPPNNGTAATEVMSIVLTGFSPCLLSPDICKAAHVNGGTITSRTIGAMQTVFIRIGRHYRNVISL
jgi:hypothetical protein